MNIKHPPSLKIFFGTEMWERYGFYVVQTLLALYLALHFKWEDAKVYPLVGSFTALTYISPVIGGWIADKLLGQKRSVLLGALILFLNYFTLGFLKSSQHLIVILAGIAVGTGLLKPNISSLLGNEYAVDSPNRESGFTVFYMGITAGIVLGTILPSYINELFGWSTTFFSASLGMIIALCVFGYGIWRFQIADYHPYEKKPGKIIYAGVIIILMWLGAFHILRDPLLANGVFSGVVLLSVAYVLVSVLQEPKAQARQTLVIGLLCMISAMFWAFYFQMFMSLTLFLKRVAEPTLFGMNFPPPYYVAVQSIGMFIFGYFLAQSKSYQNLSQHIMGIGNKFLLSMLLMTSAYLLITVVCQYSDNALMLSPLWIIPAFLIISLAELLLSPVGLAAITILASHKKVSTMMGIFFVSLGLGAFCSGKLAALTAISKNEIHQLSVLDLKIRYASSFSTLLTILATASVLSILLNRIIKYLMTKTVP